MQSLLEKNDSRTRAVTTPKDLSRVRKIGIAWYRREDYAEVRTAMIDGDVLPESYDDWLRCVSQVVTIEEAMGSAIVKATIAPKSFVDWCLATGQAADMQARTRFVNEAVEDFCRRR